MEYDPMDAVRYVCCGGDGAHRWWCVGAEEDDSAVDPDDTDPEDEEADEWPEDR